MAEEDEKAYIDLEKIDVNDIYSRKQIIEFCLGNIPGGYLEFCKKCGGFGTDNNNKIETAKQLN